MKKIRLIWKIITCLIGLCSLILLGLYTYAYFSPKINLKNSNRIVMLDNKGDIFYENTIDNSWVSLDKISDYAKNAIISTEDKNFYNHRGFDYLRIVKALYNDIKNNNLEEGASTISQQYIKNLFLTFDKTWERKIEEAFLTYKLEIHYSKDEILEGYLNTINFGGGNYGIEEASKYYFNKHASELTLAESAMIVGIPKNPTYYNPIYYYENAKNRQWIVLNSMVNNNIISEEEANEAFNEELKFYGIKENNYITSSRYYKDAVLNELQNLNEIPKSLLETGGFIIYTNLDLESQKNLENIIKEEIDSENDIQTAAIIRDVKTGKIVSLIGGNNYNLSEFNRATNAKRQVGSTFKPILYYAALENGMTSSSLFNSSATTFSIGNNEHYSPSNYGNIYANKDITMALALALSDNVYAVKTHLFLGTDTLKQTAKKMGISEELNNIPALALGTQELSMVDFSNAYATLANNGIKNKPYFISKVTDLEGNLIYEYKYEEEQVLDSRYVYILNDLMENTYNYSYIDYTSPTLLSIKGLLTKRYAVKSGTTDTDYWVCGYNPDVLVMVWQGYDDNRKISDYSSRGIKNIWAKTIEMYLNDREEVWYEIPSGVVGKIINPITGSKTDLAVKDMLYYIHGTEP